MGKEWDNTTDKGMPMVVMGRTMSKRYKKS